MSISIDLHVLSPPLAFVLSQDQTLHSLKGHLLGCVINSRPKASVMTPHVTTCTLVKDQGSEELTVLLGALRRLFAKASNDTAFLLSLSRSILCPSPSLLNPVANTLERTAGHRNLRQPGEGQIYVRIVFESSDSCTTTPRELPFKERSDRDNFLSDAAHKIPAFPPRVNPLFSEVTPRSQTSIWTA